MTVRSADPADLPRIAAIYDEQVAGVLPEVGRKFHRWVDTALYVLVL